MEGHGVVVKSGSIGTCISPSRIIFSPICSFSPYILITLYYLRRLIADGLRRCLGMSKVISIGYPVFPDSNISEQAQSILSALMFLADDANTDNVGLENISEYVIAGHSSGANICALGK